MIAIILCSLAIVFGAISFWRLSGGSVDTVSITDYVVTILPQQKKSYGFGGLLRSSVQDAGSYKNADVPFQSRTMSSFSFSISNRGDDGFWIEGEEDRLQVNGKQADFHSPVRLTNGTNFKTVGRYGSASFTTHLDEEPNRVRLQLRSPIYYQLKSNRIRLSFGLSNELVNSPIDEVFIRTVLSQNQVENFVLEKKQEGGFLLRWEPDLARPLSSQSQLISALRVAGQGAREADISPETAIHAGTAIVKLSGNAGSNFFSSNSASIFGLKIGFLIILLAIAFGLPGFGMHTTQVRLPHGPVIFGSVAILSVIGLALTARDYLLPPYSQDHFPEYSKWLFISFVILYSIRIPIQHFRELQWIKMMPIFVLIYVVFNKPFEGVVALPPITTLALLVLTLAAVPFLIHFLMRAVSEFIKLAVNANWVRVVLFVCIPILLVIVVTIASGGRSALTVFGSRIHLPTLFMPILILGTVLVVSAAEAEQSSDWLRHRKIALASILLMIGLYYILSGRDHGGTAVLCVGVLAGMWASSRKSRPWGFTIALGAVFLIVMYLAIVFGQQRVDIALGGTEGAQRYFDEWVNLRTARDLARSGGLLGLYDRLYIPSSVSMNIYNDLVATYVAGFFGLVGLALMAVAYFLFYTRLLGGIFKLIDSKEQQVAPSLPSRAEARPEMPSPLAAARLPKASSIMSNSESIRHVLVAFGMSLITAFLFQLLWMLTANFWSKIPFSGLDLQPISASRISILAFIIILLGSINWIHNVNPPQQQGAPITP